ncbi:hypothetical protein [Neisseria perflava]|uniref:hypothetical protein n=1 Tax=Neisseria perflava TaxID=33053 RepID=UPI00209CEEF8|nr:hypothetical protein [Neisseria perflava]MCP1661138.1 hypothetical protein [Neisseria perflava]MCP1772815.1 hypothetical protein [Neisseria perflava]
MVVRLKNETLYPHYGRNRSPDAATVQKRLDCTPYDYLMVRSRKAATELQTRFQSNPTCRNMRLDFQTAGWLLFKNAGATP